MVIDKPFSDVLGIAQQPERPADFEMNINIDEDHTLKTRLPWPINLTCYYNNCTSISFEADAREELNFIIRWEKAMSAKRPLNEVNIKDVENIVDRLLKTIGAEHE